MLPKLLACWLAAVTGLALLAWGSHSALQPASRRACNATYVLWILALCWGGLGTFACIDVAAILLQEHELGSDANLQQGQRSQEPQLHLRVLEAFNRQGMRIFLLANIVTGVLNMSCDLKQWAGWQGQVAVAAYMAFLSAAGLWWNAGQQRQ